MIYLMYETVSETVSETVTLYRKNFAALSQLFRNSAVRARHQRASVCCWSRTLWFRSQARVSKELRTCLIDIKIYKQIIGINK